MQSLLQKYDVPAPRYTSYPTVPYWTEESPKESEWLSHVVHAFEKDARLSLYIHLPFCEQLCTYCGCNKHITRNHAVESPYIDAVLKEWQMYLTSIPVKPVLRELHLGGGTPTFFQPENLQQLVAAILDTVDVAPDAEFSFEAHPNGTTREHLKALYNLGFRRISIGVQDFDDEILRLIHRFQTKKQVEELHSMAREMGYNSINYDLIFGLPRQTKSHIFNTVAEIHQLKPDRIAFYSYAHVPWLKNGQRAYDESDLPQAAAKRELYETGRMLLEAEGYADIGLDHFALPNDGLYHSAQKGEMHRNFMGYTSVYTPNSIGLGASSISDVGTAFMQNIKSVAEYQEAIALGALPIFRGHYLSEEDQIIRQHILNLMCRYQTSWQDADNYTPTLVEAEERLSEVLKDGLVALSPGSVKVTSLGKAFLRNIALAFDARYWAKVPNSRVFSQAV